MFPLPLARGHGEDQDFLEERLFPRLQVLRDQLNLKGSTGGSWRQVFSQVIEINAALIARFLEKAFASGAVLSQACQVDGVFHPASSLLQTNR